MLSLISLILASGSILKGETEEWTAATYPNPSINAALCNTWQNATLCDPDHILSEHWRSVIIENIERQKGKILSLDKIYTDSTPKECYTNSTVEIYVILARKIKTASNESTTNDELVKFGDDIVSKYGLNDKKCNNYVMLLGVEAAKIAYVRAGTSLKLPKNFFHTVFNRTTNLFREKNYMEGLNKIIDEMGDEMVNLFNEIKQTTKSFNNESIETTILDTLPKDTIINATYSTSIDNEYSKTNIPKSLKYNMSLRKNFENENEISSYNGINTYEENLMNAFFIILIILFFILLISIVVLLFSQYYKKHNDSGLTDIVIGQSKNTVISPPIINEAKFKDRHNDIEPDPEFLNMLKRRESSRFSEVIIHDLLNQTNLNECNIDNGVLRSDNDIITSTVNSITNTIQPMLSNEAMKTDHFNIEEIKKELTDSKHNLDIIEEVDEPSTLSLDNTKKIENENFENKNILDQSSNFVENDVINTDEKIKIDTLDNYNEERCDLLVQKNDDLIKKEKLNTVCDDTNDDDKNNISNGKITNTTNDNNKANGKEDIVEDININNVESSNINKNNGSDNLHLKTHIDKNNNTQDDAKNTLIPITAINLIPDDGSININENFPQIE
ncbi:TPM domain-containing protein [Strongyloides ratti]|uniref:TPM domain-containing protein n=1 Tax=Strongyloides ratti TaxID=34506 RepID=A0A090KUJ4_STRRB|nr:TPM domain-containing protein [Strongyloides ratti]CEF59545.1 TPM domain-containing protein [Strongyloides ratti]